MSRNVITPEEGEELRQLQIAHHEATLRGFQIMQQFGMDSSEFAAADKATGILKRRIDELTDGKKI